MSRSKTKPVARLLAACIAGIALGPSLGGCSDIYYARRDTVALSGGDAVAANAIEQTVDPWPPHSGDKNIAFNGQKMQSAVERYRTNKVIPPVSSMTSNVAGPQGQAEVMVQGPANNSLPPASGAPSP